MATSSLPPSPAFISSVCQMFSYSSTSFSDNGTRNKCSLFVLLEARLSELEARLCTVENHLIASQAPLASAEPTSLASSISICRPVKKGGWLVYPISLQYPRMDYKPPISIIQVIFTTMVSSTVNQPGITNKIHLLSK